MAVNLRYTEFLSFGLSNLLYAFDVFANVILAQVYRQKVRGVGGGNGHN